MGLLLICNQIGLAKSNNYDIMKTKHNKPPKIDKNSDAKGYYNSLINCQPYAYQANFKNGLTGEITSDTYEILGRASKITGEDSNACITQTFIGIEKPIVKDYICTFPDNVAKEIGTYYSGAKRLPEGYGCYMDVYSMKYCQPAQGKISPRCKFAFDNVLGKKESDRIFDMLNAKNRNNELLYSLDDIGNEIQKSTNESLPQNGIKSQSPKASSDKILSGWQKFYNAMSDDCTQYSFKSEGGRSASLNKINNMCVTTDEMTPDSYYIQVCKIPMDKIKDYSQKGYDNIFKFNSKTGNEWRILQQTYCQNVKRSNIK